jgi:hypothetical protein
MAIDSVHFTEELVEQYFSETVNWIFELFKNTVDNDSDKAVSIEEGTEQVDNELNLISNDNEDSDVIDEHALRMYNLVKLNKQRGIHVGADDAAEALERKQSELKESIKRSMKAYRAECCKINIVAWLDEYGNNLYKEMKKKGKTLESIRVKHKDALYIAQYFEATTWWWVHEKTYPELALAACIVLGKPTHNAFQERVFSRGTYSDSNLRKSLKEENFEMSVLNAVNNKVTDECYEMVKPIIDNILKETQTSEKECYVNEITQYMEKRKIEKQFDVVTIDDKDDDEFESVCSQCTADMNMDDDEIDICDSTDYRDFMVSENEEDEVCTK